MRSYSDRETYFRRKRVVLTERDELAYSRVIREFCPAVMFFGLEPGDMQQRSRPLASIAHDRSDHATVMLPAPGQENRWRMNLEMGFVVVWPDVRLDLNRSQWTWMDPTKKWAFDPPLMDWGEVVIAYPKGDKEMKRFAGKLLRLVGMVTWKQSGYGLDACRWSQAGGKERRGLGSGTLIDPNEKIELNKYYDDTLWDDGGLPDEPTGVRV